MPFPSFPIIVTEQTTTMVKFRVQNTFVEQLSSLYVQFAEGSTGDNQCFPEYNVDRGEFVEYTAYCMKNCPIAIVDVWARDNGFPTIGNNAVIPECCHPIGGPNEAGPTVQYTFKIHCDSQCPTHLYPSRMPSRRLSEHDNKDIIHEGSLDALAEFKDMSLAAAAAAGNDVVELDNNMDLGDAHFCTSEDYPCGDDNDKVYVCHYSARHGYQTFCVPEQDSDIMSFYQKDYCGPCVGGYRSDLSSSSVIA
jgi:hypothetical protein